MNAKSLQAVIISLLALVCMVGCSQEGLSTEQQQRTAINEILSSTVNDEQIEKVQLSDAVAQKFPAVEKVYKVLFNGEEHYGFVTNPVGYEAPINLMVLINAQLNQVTGIKVMQHNETEDYADWLTETWFADRFRGKSVDEYLIRTVLEAEKPNEIIQITGASVSSQAVVNGVNSAIGAYREVILGQPADPVPLEVEGFVTGH